MQAIFLSDEERKHSRSSESRHFLAIFIIVNVFISARITNFYLHALEIKSPCMKTPIQTVFFYLFLN
jgi:hypothetical protein